MDTSKTIKIIDRLIYVFIIIFLLSLTNSIFVNQIGYYGGLLLMLIRFFITRENRFQRSGLELVFAWFIIAEIISGLLSVNTSYSLNNLLKRVLLMPVVYVILAGVTDFKTGKKFFYIYLGASLITSIIYVYFAFKAYTQSLYGLEGIGASLFQYPITASEIISFSVVFLFAFLINEKVNWKYKLLILIAFGLSVASLIGTYKRTGWIGAAFGIFIILIVKKEWRLLIPGAALAIVLVLIQKNISEVKIFEYRNDSEISLLHSFDTDGRATHIYPLNEKYFLSDYENGLVTYLDTTIIRRIDLPGAVIRMDLWKDYYVANLIDSRFFLLKKEPDGNKIIKDEFISPGFVVDWTIFNNYLYVLDTDSGLTIFKDPENLNNIVRLPDVKRYNFLFVDAAYTVFYSAGRRITIYETEEGIPARQIYDSTYKENITSAFYSEGKLLIPDNKSLRLFNVDTTGITLKNSTDEAKGIYLWRKEGNRLFAAGIPAALYELSINENIEIESNNNLNFFPASASYANGKIILTRVERSKLSSIWDPHIPSNFTRLALWRVGWEIFKDYPIFGVGDINMGQYQLKYKRNYEKEIHGHLHNNFIHILAALGLFGLLAVCFMLIKMYIINFRIYRKHKNEKFLSSYSLGTIGALSAFIFSGLTELNIWDHEIITLVYFTFALNVALNRNKEKEIEKGK